MALADVGLLLDKIVSALEKEASSLKGINDELKDLKYELASMKSFLEDAERKKSELEVEKTWVANVREIAYEVEDIIDEFTYHVNQQQCGSNLSRFLSMPRNLWLRRQIAFKLQKIKKRIRLISERTMRYGVKSIQGAPSSVDDQKRLLNIRESSLFVKEDKLVGIQEESQLLKRWLMDDEAEQTVISVVGIGGSGKTTLVGKVYNNESIKCRFDCYAWITVSQTYSASDLCRNLIKEFYLAKEEQVPVDLSAMDYKQQVKMLLCYLEHKRYLVVLDDVWDINPWGEIEASLPHNRRGNRVVLTTRKESVGSFSFGVRSHTLHVQPLAQSEAWSLFCMKAFSNKACPKQLELLAQELLSKCAGLPLAIVALGGLMSSKRTVMEWSHVRNNLNSQLSNNPELQVLRSILLLSFSDLPYPLKHCFLYCCLFPEDYLITRKRLVRLWIAGGFVQEVNRMKPEGVADSYLLELTCRGMLQVVEKNSFGRPKACKMHDLMRELAISISEREKLCAVYDGRAVIEDCEARCLSIQKTEGDLKPFSGMPRLRSFFLFAVDSPSFSNAFLSKFKLLRVLDLEDVPIDKLPNEIKLFNLRYLNLRGTQVKELPKSIGRLFSLQALNISNTLIEELPKEVAQLQNLEHLVAYRVHYEHFLEFQLFSGTRAQFKINKLKKLRVLCSIEAEGDIIGQFGSMTQLTKIGITNVREVDEMDLCSSIQKLKLLSALYLKVANKDEFLQTDALSSPPPQLQKLDMYGKLERVPHWFCSLYCLHSLVLNWSRLGEDPLPHIAALPSLSYLSLTNAFVGEKLYFSTGFANLSILLLLNFPHLTEIVIEKGVMPDVKDIHLVLCMELSAVPQGIQYLTNVQELVLRSVSSDLIDSIRGEKSRDRWKVQHITFIKHIFGTPDGLFHEMLS